MKTEKSYLRFAAWAENTTRAGQYSPDAKERLPDGEALSADYDEFQFATEQEVRDYARVLRSGTTRTTGCPQSYDLTLAQTLQDLVPHGVKLWDEEEPEV